MSDDPVEVMAKVLAPDTGGKLAVELAQRALAALDAAGFAVVPREPTRAMLEAARKHANAAYIENGYWAWEVMLNAYKQAEGTTQ